MKKFLAYETTTLSLFLSLVLAVLTLSWQAHLQANPYEIPSVEERPEGRPSVTSQGFNRFVRSLREELKKCREHNPPPPSCNKEVTRLEVPVYGFFLTLEENGLVFRSPNYERDIPTGDCSKYYIRNFFDRITSIRKYNVSEGSEDAIEVHTNGLIFSVDPGSESFDFIEGLPSEVSSLASRIAMGCTGQ